WNTMVRRRRLVYELYDLWFNHYAGELEKISFLNSDLMISLASRISLVRTEEFWSKENCEVSESSKVLSEIVGDVAKWPTECGGDFQGETINGVLNREISKFGRNDPSKFYNANNYYFY